jgi:hypothetical protein
MLRIRKGEKILISRSNFPRDALFFIIELAVYSSGQCH